MYLGVLGCVGLGLVIRLVVGLVADVSTKGPRRKEIPMLSTFLRCIIVTNALDSGMDDRDEGVHIGALSPFNFVSILKLGY